jgi:MoxR-like ATPase
MLLATTGAREAKPLQALGAAELMAAQALIRRIPVGESVLDAILTWSAARGRRVRRSRASAASSPGAPGPRAAQALMLATRARAVLDGRLAPSVEDVLALAEPVLRHRMALTFSARADGVQLGEVIATLKGRIA